MDRWSVLFFLFCMFAKDWLCEMEERSASIKKEEDKNNKAIAHGRQNPSHFPRFQFFHFWPRIISLFEKKNPSTFSKKFWNSLDSFFFSTTLPPFLPTSNGFLIASQKKFVVFLNGKKIFFWPSFSLHPHLLTFL